MSKAQGDKYRTWTDVEMNNRVYEHEKKWRQIIKPHYDELVNEITKEFEQKETEQYRIVIRTRQFNDVVCIGKTRFWLGTLNKEDYKVEKTNYIVTVVMIDKNTNEKTYLQHDVFDSKEEANKFFLQMKQYLK